MQEILLIDGENFQVSENIMDKVFNKHTHTHTHTHTVN